MRWERHLLLKPPSPALHCSSKNIHIISESFQKNCTYMKGRIISDQGRISVPRCPCGGKSRCAWAEEQQPGGLDLDTQKLPQVSYRTGPLIHFSQECWVRWCRIRLQAENYGYSKTWDGWTTLGTTSTTRSIWNQDKEGKISYRNVSRNQDVQRISDIVVMLHWQADWMYQYNEFWKWARGSSASTICIKCCCTSAFWTLPGITWLLQMQVSLIRSL